MYSHMPTITTSLSYEHINFLRERAKKEWRQQNHIIQQWLDLYKKHLIEEQIKQWISERYDEYKTIIEDFSDTQFNSLPDIIKWNK